VFYNTTIAYPGPGKYNPSRPQSKSNIVLAGRPNTSFSTISPGPKYNFESTLLDRNKILSQEKRKGSCRIVLPASKSRLANSEPSDSKLNINIHSSGTTTPYEVSEGLMTYKGNRMFGQSGSHAIISRE
jgi:hypothetical protein